MHEAGVRDPRPLPRVRAGKRGGARRLPDPVEDLRAFADKYGLAFTLLSDADHQVAERYGVWVEKHRDGRTWWGNRRSTALIDPEGNIARVFEDVDPAGHDELMLGALRDAAASA